MGHTQRAHARARTRACSFLSEGLPSALDGVKIEPNTHGARVHFWAENGGVAVALRALLKKYEEQWHYLIVGCCTTLINYILYFLLSWLGMFYIASNVLAWAGAVAFAYFANAAWVYKSTSRRSIREATAFVLSRVFSLGLETALLAVMVEMLGIGEYISKIVVGVVVVVVNYLTGLLVYKKI